MQSIKNSTRLMALNERLVLDGVVVGITAGFFSISYRYVLVHLTQLRQVIIKQSEPSIIAAWFVFLFAAGYIVHILLKYEPLSSGSGIPQIQGELLGAFDMKPRKVLLSKYIGGCLANLAGLSLGREGPSIQIGASVGKICSNLRSAYFGYAVPYTVNAVGYRNDR